MQPAAKPRKRGRVPPKPKPRPLTQRERDTLDALSRLTREHGYPPTLRELAAALGLRSMAHVCEMLCKLEDRGIVASATNKPRTLRIVGPIPKAAP